MQMLNVSDAKCEFGNLFLKSVYAFVAIKKEAMDSLTKMS